MFWATTVFFVFFQFEYRQLSFSWDVMMHTLQEMTPDGPHKTVRRSVRNKLGPKRLSYSPQREETHDIKKQVRDISLFTGLRLKIQQFEPNFLSTESPKESQTQPQQITADKGGWGRWKQCCGSDCEYEHINQLPLLLLKNNNNNVVHINDFWNWACWCVSVVKYRVFMDSFQNMSWSAWKPSDRTKPFCLPSTYLG